MISKKIIFFSSGSKISSILNLPDDYHKDKLPCIIFAHGYASYKDEFGGFIKLAEIACSKGFAVLRFDFRGCGESTNIRKKGQMLCATEWTEDICNAYTLISNMDCVNHKKISILGISMGGATVLSSVQFINSLKSVVVLCPVANGYSWLKNLWIKKSGLKAWKKFNDRIDKERNNRVLKNIDNFINLEEALAYPEKDLEFFKELVRNYPQMSPISSFSSIEEIIYRVNPLNCIKKFKNHKILFVHGTDDTAVPFRGTTKMYKNYKGEKSLLLLKNRSHALVLEKDCDGYLEDIINWIVKNNN